MRSALNQTWKPIPRYFGGIAASILLSGASAQAQLSQFLFDRNGNLTAQLSQTLLAPQITGQPQDQIVATNESASFSVVVADPRSLTYQWRFNGSDLSGETGS